MKSHLFGWIMAVLLIIYIGLLVWLPKELFWSPDEGAKFLNMQAISWEDGLHFTIPYNGADLDSSFEFYPRGYPTKHVYPQPSNQCNIRFNWPLWFPLLSLIPYHLLGIWGLYLLPLLCGWATAVFAGLIAHRLHPKAAIVTLLLVGLATPILFYSVLFWEHTLATFLAVFALWLIIEWPYRAIKWPTFLGIGATLLWGIALRLETVVFVGSLLLALLLAYWPQSHSIYKQLRDKSIRSHYKWHYLTSCVLLSAMAWLLFIATPPQENSPASYCQINKSTANTAAILLSRIVAVQDKLDWATVSQNDNEFSQAEPSYTADFASVVGFRNAENWNDLPRLINHLFLSEEIHAPMWVLFSAVVGAGLVWAGGLLKGQYRFWFWMVGVMLLSIFAAAVLFSEERYRFVRSIFLPAPYLLLFIYLDWRKPNVERRIILFTSGIYLFLGTVATLSRGNPNILAGTEWGARYMLHFYPVATVATAVMLVELYEKTKAKQQTNLQMMLSGALLLIVLGLLFNGRGLRELALTKSDLRAQQTVLSEIDVPIVTDIFWYPAAFAPYYAQHEMYMLNQPQDLQLWLETAVPQVNQFYHVSFTPFPPVPVINGHQLAVQSTEMSGGIYFTEIQVTSRP